MKKAVFFLSLSLLIVFGVFAQEAQPEPTMVQRLGFYGLTGAGLLFIFLAYRQRMKGKKK